MCTMWNTNASYYNCGTGCSNDNWLYNLLFGGNRSGCSCQNQQRVCRDACGNLRIIGGTNTASQTTCGCGATPTCWNTASAYTGGSSACTSATNACTGSSLSADAYYANQYGTWTTCNCNADNVCNCN